ncbi:hypothetical protein BDV28DRAFT_41348 [Aspergillus coremiiformis]|uniref:Polyketide synthase n=1 Tax=Aspergillus coremiiformis TaxID=138285 RepID=A0A5N6ZIR3_9EURO|nr:hypothetical protein BDV28DRAFT_41348 [Aspergillus coremiiformis]
MSASMEQCCNNVAFPAGANVKEPDSNHRPTPVWLNRDGVTDYIADNVREDPIPFPVAIVGMGMRLPGGVNSGKEFWDFLVNKRDGLCRVPETRYNVDAFYDESREGAVRTKHGYFLEQDIGQLDLGFFGISKLEAEKLDPQQRLLLEVVWECMENAGQTNWQGTNIGFFVGVFGEDWLDLLSKDTQQNDRYRVMSAGDFALSNRVSYEYDLRGPSVTVRTGCSSSMVGLHEACQAIYTGECSSAIVAGTNLIMSPTMTTTMSENLVLSSSGLCRTFDAAADGYGRGEAINAVYIKPLDDALADGDPIRAIIRSTTVNCDGRTPSITTPGSAAQERLIRRAYKKARIEDDDMQKTAFFECHGTGTIAGDTAETTGLANIFGENGIYIGAVKPNVGHSEGASGITSIIKCVLALENNIIPPNVHFETPNPKVPFESAKLQVPVEPTPWPADRRKRISVNSFGIGGTNAHVILDAASTVRQETSADVRTTSEPDCHLLILSAKDKQSLDGQIERISAYAESNPASLNDLAFTLARRRDHLPYRAFAVTDKDGSLSTFEKAQSTAPSIVFVFSGQGAQWPTMGKDLMLRFPKFRDDIHRMDKVLTELSEAPTWSIEEELSKTEESSRVGDAEFAQPLCTAIQIALVNLLRDWGVVPSSVVGHSSGEIAAAYASGAISARIGIILSYFRGQAIKALSASRCGAMAAVGLSPEAARAYLVDGVTIACENSPASVTLSGDKDALDSVLNKIHADDKDVFYRRLAVDVAYHSHHMQESKQAYEALISPHLCHNDSMLPFYSSVISAQILEPRELDAAYWSQNLASPVMFRTAVQQILHGNTRSTLFLEVGPHSSLAGPLRQIFQEESSKENLSYVPTLRRGAGQWESLLATLGQMYAHGTAIGLSVIFTSGVVLNDLPPYSWKHGERYWNESRLVNHWRLRQEPHHELLGSRALESTSVEPSWRNILQLDQVPWLADHRIGKDIVFPCAAYVAMVGEAIRQITESTDYSVRNMFMRAVLNLETSDATELITTLRPTKLADNIDSVWYDFTISAFQKGTWKKHCIGQVRPGSDKEFEAKAVNPYPRSIRSEKWYSALEKRGLEYGPQFRGLEQISASPSSYQAAATLHDDEALYVSHYSLHPILIDESLQLLSVAVTHGIPRKMTRLAIPMAIGDLYIGSGRGKMSLDVSCDTSGGSMQGNAMLVSDDRVVLSLRNGIFFSIQDPDLGKPKLPVAATIHWNPHIDFVPSEKQLPQLPSDLNVRRRITRLVGLFIVETYYQTRFSQPTTDHLRKWHAWIASYYHYMRDNIPALVPELRDICALSPTERDAAFEELDCPSLDGVSFPFYRICKRILGSIEKLLDGQQEPIDLLIEDGALREFYEQTALVGRWYDFAFLLGHSNPQLRVLEVGGGTGGDTLIALKGLTLENNNRLYSTYTFTDISPGFLLEAKERFRSHPSMEYATLDISRDPIEQGFQPESYDLIIASNVVHATPRISDSLCNIRRLLAPGGRLMLIELTCTIPIIDYLMGILPGWWLGEGEGRGERPYIPVDKWHNELVNAGFKGVETFRYDSEPPYQVNAHILSRVPSVKPPERGEVWLLYRTVIKDWAQDLARELTATGYSVRWCTIKQAPSPGANIISLIDLEGPFFHELTPTDFESFQSYVSSLIDSHLVWLTRSVQMECDDPRYALVLGVARTIRHEIAPNFATLEIDQVDRTALRPVAEVFEWFLFQKNEPGATQEYEFALREGAIHVPRLHWSSFEAQQVEVPESQVPRILDIEAYAMLDSLTWTCADLASDELGKEEIEVDIKYVGLNFRDMMIVMGFMGDMTELGLEGSGIIRRVGSAVNRFAAGDRVMISQAGLMCTRKIVPADRCLPIPDDLSLEDASTILCVYATVVYSLIYVGDLKPGQSVLIHSACGGVGLAAIQICQLIGAEIYATVGSEEKAQHLIKSFKIQPDHIFDSRSSSFLHGVLEKTNNRGVDLVLNSLSGELLHASWKCVAKFGKMLELGKRDFLGHGHLEMDLFAGNRSFIGIDLLQVVDHNPEILHEMVARVMGYFQEGKAGPISPVNVFDAATVVKAFRYMQSGQHMGKIVVKMPESPSDLPVTRAYEKAAYFPADASYLLVGGLGGLGRAVATWMVEKGARHLVFLSRSGANSPEVHSFIKTLECQGCDVTAVAGNVADIDHVRRAAFAAKKPIAGVIQLSMVLKDQSLHIMTHEEWVTALYPKVKGTWNLHHVLKDTPLDFFLLISSMVGLLGWPGQANYGAANAFLDAFVKYRQSLGLPAHTIDLGLMGDIGYVSQSSLTSAFEVARANSLQVLDEGKFLQAVEMAVLAPRFNCPNQVAVGLGTTTSLSSADITAQWTKEARFSTWNNIITTMERPTEGARADELREHMEAIKNNPALLDQPETEEKIVRELGKLIASYTSRSEDMTQDELSNIPIDSLMTFEIRTWFRRHAGIEITLVEVSNSGTVSGLSKIAIQKLRDKLTQKGQDGDKDGRPDTVEEEASYHDDLALGKTMRPISNSITDWISESEGHVFFTGATGFLGAFLLSELIALPQVKHIACLIRATTPDIGITRIKQTFVKYGLPVDFGSKVIAIPGDVSKRNLGLRPETFNHWAEWSSVIFHFVGYVNYTLPYSVHRETNVLGLLELLRFANTQRLKPVHYCSSISACGITKDLIGPVPEDIRPLAESQNVAQSIGYTQSKFVAESIIWNAIENGFPIAIYRPPVVTGHSRTGMCKREDMVNRLMANCIRLGCYPRPPQHRFHFVPVDFACSAISRISLSSASPGHAFNITQPDQDKVMTFAGIFDILSEYSPSPMRCISTVDFIQQYTKKGDSQVKVSAPVVAERLSVHKIWWDDWDYMAVYSTENLQRAMANNPDIIQLRPTHELLKVYYNYWSRED